MEAWKDIPKFEGLYQVSNFGNIKSLTKIGSKGRLLPEMMLKPQLSSKGYLGYVFRKNNKPNSKTIHRLVAELFIENPNNLPQVNHKNGNKKDNHVDNLEWISSKGNIQHSFDIGLRSHLLTSIDQYSLDGKYIKTWKSSSEPAKELGIRNSDIHRCCKAFYTSKAGGFRWRLSEDTSEINYSRLDINSFKKAIRIIEISSGKVTEFERVLDASTSLGVSNTQLGDIINGTRKNYKILNYYKIELVNQ